MGCHDMSVKDVNLSVNQRRAIGALLECSRIEDAADRAGVTDRTIYRWLQDPFFVAELRQAETTALGDAIRSLIADQKSNYEVMRSVRDDRRSSAAVRLRAAVALDNSLLKWRQFIDFEERITELERVIYAKEQKTY